jgi:hypothetical protein
MPTMTHRIMGRHHRRGVTGMCAMVRLTSRLDLV